QGEQTFAWYRGPLVPAPVVRTRFAPITTSGAAVIYDQQSGLFDQSYAVAWETGRMLALADRSFATTLMGWRAQGQTLLTTLMYQLQQTDPSFASTLQPALSDVEQTETPAEVQTTQTAVDEVRSLLEPDLLTPAALNDA